MRIRSDVIRHNGTLYLASLDIRGGFETRPFIITPLSNLPVGTVQLETLGIPSLPLEDRTIRFQRAYLDTCHVAVLQVNVGTAS